MIVTIADIGALSSSQLTALGAASNAVRTRARGEQDQHGVLWQQALPAAYGAVMYPDPSWDTPAAIANGVTQVALNAIDGKV